MTGTTEQKAEWLCIIGSPVAHSVSPAMHQAAIQALGIPAGYVALDVEAAGLEKALDALRTLNIKGFNVTMPLKQAICPLLDDLDESAAILGAVNTVVRQDGGLKGYSTDGAGYIEGLKKDGVTIAGSRVFLFGAGGAGRAILYALCREGAAEVWYTVRREETVRACQRMLARFQTDTVVTPVKNNAADIQSRLYDCDLIINATPQGMGGGTSALLSLFDFSKCKPSAVVSDIVYHPLNTAFLQQAQQNGLAIHTGEKMLLYQAVLAFRLWFGVEPPFDVMRDALYRALN